MKKITLILLALFISATYVSSQGLVILDEHDNDITFGQLVVRDDADEVTIKANVFFMNDTDGNVQVLARKIEVDILEGTVNTFCWNGSCFPPFIDEAPENMPIVLGPGETSTDMCFYGEYTPNGQSGFSIIEYEFFSAGTCFETVKTTVIYATNGVPYIIFHPGDGAENIAVDQSLVLKSDISLSLEDGTTITEESLQDVINFRLGDASGQLIAFDASINEESTEITIHPREDLAYETSYFLEVLPLMGFEGEVSEPKSIVFTTVEAPNPPVVTFNVDQGAVDVSVDHVFVITADQQIWHADGTEITNENLSLLINFREGDAEGNEVSFNATINDEHTQITLNSTDNLAYETGYFLEVLPLMGAEGDISEPQSVSFTTEEETETSLAKLSANAGHLSDPFPNPATDHTSIRYDLPAGTQQAYVNFYTVTGMLLERIQLNTGDNQTRINTSGWQSGIYFYRLTVDEAQVASGKLIISK